METTWSLWVRNWDNAYRFFNSKGNAKTKARLKKKWHDDFMKIFNADMPKQVRQIKMKDFNSSKPKKRN